MGSLSFVLERWDETLQEYLPVTDERVPALSALGAPQGGTYNQVDDGANSGETYRYRLIEEETWGGTRIHGPFEVTVDGGAVALAQARVSQPPSSTTGAARLRGRTRGGQARAGESAMVEMVANGRFRARAHKLKRRSRSSDAGVEKGAHGRPGALVRTEPRRRSGLSIDAASTLAAPAALSAASENITRARLEVAADGLYQVSAAAIAAALGEQTTLVQRWIRRGVLALSSQGVPVAWEPQDRRGNGIRFYGATPPENPYTARTVYWIERGQGALMASEPAAVEGAVEGQTYTASERFETDSFALSNGGTDPESDYWRWAVMSGDASWNSFETWVALPDLVPGVEASLRLDLQSIRDVGNAVVVWVNGTPLPDPVAWDGAREYTATLTIPAGVLQEGDNHLLLEAQPGVGGTSYVYLDGFTLDFERFAVARDGALEVAAPAEGPFSIDGFDGRQIAVYRLGAQPVRLKDLLIDQGAQRGRA